MRTKLVKDPVHGYIELGEDELRVVDTPAFQRLRRIIQLPFVYLVYPGARHTRFDHSLGCMHLAGEFAWRLGLDEHRRKVLRLAALLHDVGHTPYSHLLESLLLERGMTHEDVSARILREDPKLAEAIEGCGVRVGEVVEVLEGRTPESKAISGPTDVDKLDFLLRDSYFTGASYGMVDVKRILWRSRLSSEGVLLSIRAVGAVEEMALARYQSFMNIYFHHAVRAAQSLFLRGVRRLGIDFTSMRVEEYLGHDDYTIWCLMKQHEEVREVIKRIEERRLPKLAYELRFEGEMPRELREGRSLEQLEEEIAEDAGVPREHVWIDTPYIPPLPYRGDEQIKFYEEGPGGEIKLVEYSSPLLTFTSRIYGIVRVYTEREYLERVRGKAEKVLSNL